MRQPSARVLLVVGLWAHAACRETAPTLDAPDAGALDGASAGTDAAGLAPDLASPFVAGTLDVPLTVKAMAGTSAAQFPVSAVVPLPAGSHQTTTGMRVVAADGTAVPSQVEVLARRSAGDNSIRHVAVHFLADVAAAGAAGYRLKDDALPAAPTQPTGVVESATELTLAAGSESVVVTRSPFAITSSRGALTAEMLVNRADGATELQRSFERDDITIEVEERGPIRSVVRCSAPTRYTAGGEHVHGWALRLYTYANQQFVKVDFQIQNSARTAKYAAPLYFDYVDLVWSGGAPATASALTAEKVTVDPRTLPLGWLASDERAVHLRHFQARWPSGLMRSADGTIRVELWPRWSAEPDDEGGGTSATGMYWLDDMRQIVKETYLVLGPIPDGEASAWAARFEQPPVVVVPYAWWQSTRASLDFGGRLPKAPAIAPSDERTPPYDRYSPTATSWAARLSVDRFGIELDRRLVPNQTGGWPGSRARFMASESPADYLEATDFALSEINIRPEWIAGYSHATDQTTLQLTENPYGSFSWRAFDGTYGYDASSLGHRPSTGPVAKPRDDQHGWFYHVEEGWLASGNLWIRDWYRFVGEFRKTRLEERDPWPDMSSRAVGHSLGHALAAYRVASDASIIPLAQSFVERYLTGEVDPTTHGIRWNGDFRPGDLRAADGTRQAMGTIDAKEAVFQLGYLSRALITLVEESPGGHPASEALVSGFVEWNRSYANFAYYLGYAEHNAQSDGTAMTFCDAIAWTIVRGLGDPTAALAQLADYDDGGIGGGMAPYVDCAAWTGDFIARLSADVLSP